MKPHPEPRGRAVRPLALLALLAPLAAAQTPVASTPGDVAGDNFGAAVAVVGDIDGDGLPDVLVGAPATPGTPSAPGYARAHSGLDGALIQRLLTTDPADLFGFAVAGTTDIDGDGGPDLIVGSPGSHADAGSNVKLFTGVHGSLFLSLPGGIFKTWDQFGYSLASPGDLDGDGGADVVIGAPSLQGDQPGRIEGHHLQSPGALFYFAQGHADGDQFGSSLAVAGDVDLDGLPDFLVGAPGGGYADLVSGADGTELLHLPGAGGDFARAVSAAGDIDGDGVPDLAVGAPLFNRVDLLSGADGGLLARYEKFTGQFGASIAPLGDANADGVPDLLVGAPVDDVLDAVEAGTAFAISGATGQNLFKYTGATPGAHLGAAAAAGDTDGDGAPEALLGAPDQATLTGAAGTAALYDGQLAGSIVNYGIGCPGTFLITPRLDLFGDPLPNGELTVNITSALGSAPAALMIGLEPGVAPLANGCILWVQPLLVTAAFTLDGDFPGEGHKTLVGRLPASVPVGSTFALHVLIKDDGTDGGVAGTSAYFVTVQ